MSTPIVRAKFRCYTAGKTESGDEIVNLHAVYETEGPNKEWSTATPSGSLTMWISNPGAMGKFKMNQEYFIDFTPATESAS
jgi:hypothetical protein